MTHVLTVAEMTARDLLRRRTAVALLALVPLAFYLARHEMVGQSIRFASIGLAWAVSTFAAFAAAAGRGLDPQLRVAGYRAWQLLAGRLISLFGIGLVGPVNPNRTHCDGLIRTHLTGSNDQNLWMALGLVT